ncbi:LysR family transcriptional regulator [Pusillimonas sp. TS35]|uniref:LysR family transcriptional regulator n=1 Tax=Paracandidimonas lactea TaxID=2895524 RepID=UPI00136A50A5|nr:LysR family transcriptional regulator [Paracandidimonas lactea]MYN14144.1 LysR family transcriptional regulator [Pusillimonas sp. TS35]
MNFKQLTHVVALADTLSFSKAAERVHLSQSALSKSISALEEEIGIQIFARTTNKVEVAPTGQHVITHARHLLSEATSFRKNIEYLKTGELGSVALGSGPFPAASFLDTAIHQFHQRYPRVSFSIRIDHWANLLAALHAGKIDFFMADVRDIKQDATLDITPIGGLTVTLCCSRDHPLIASDPSRTVQATELLKYAFASVSLPPQMFLSLKQSMGLGPNDNFQVSIECDDMALLNRIIPGSDIILVTSNLMMETRFPNANIIKLHVPMSRNRFGEWALVKIKGRTLTPSATLLAELLIELVRQGSRQDDARHGFEGNKPLNFLAASGRGASRHQAG